MVLTYPTQGAVCICLVAPFLCVSLTVRLGLCCEEPVGINCLVKEQGMKTKTAF